MKNQFFLLRVFMMVLSLMVLFLYAFSSSGDNKFINGSSTPVITICNNQLPYHWNGLTCLTAGNYSVTLTGSNGMDSIAMLTLHVINVGTSISNAITCDNQLPYHWNGNSYSASGTYSVTLTSSSGCDSVPILSLTVNHIVTSITNKTICNNELPYQWNGNNYPATGTYTATLTSAAGCDSIATLNLYVNPVSTSSTSVTICSNQLPYHWNGNVYPLAGTYAFTLLNSNGCDSVATLVLSTKAATTSNTFETICDNQLPYAWNGNNYAQAGDFSVTLTGSNGCDSIAVLHLSVSNGTTSNTNVNICNGQLPYSWNGNSYPVPGSYSVILTGSHGCDSTAHLHLISVPFLTSSTTRTICNSAVPFSWNGIDYNSSGTYTASFVTAAGCDSIASLHLIVETAQIVTDSISICESALPYNWHGTIYSTGGTYHIVPAVVLDPCHSVDSLVLTVQVILPSTTAVAVCDNHLPYAWNGNNYSATGIYGVALTSSSGCDSIANLDLTVSHAGTSVTNLDVCSNQLPYAWNGNMYNISGVYQASLPGSNGCDSVATLDLTVKQTSTSTTDLTVCSSQLPYSWNGNNYSTNGTYIITLTNSSGCDSVATLHFVVQPFLTSTTNTIICSNQLPYNWNGNSYSAAGIFPVNLTSVAGCDSVATLNLVINDVITSLTTVNTCTNQLPYNWNGNNYNSPGNYIATLVTSGGCDSVATLNLVINNNDTTITNTVICNNQLPYNWNGNSYPVEGVYPVTLTSNSGCDSVAILNLVVTDILTSTTNVNICPAQLPYTWNGNSYSDGGTYSVTLSTAAGCDSVPILSLTIVPYVTSNTDITICNNELPYSWNGNTYTDAGTYSVLLSGTTVCDSLATINLTVLPPISSTTLADVCETQLPFNWNGNSYSTTGNYSITLASAGGCDSTATLTLSVHPTVIGSEEIAICNSQLPYHWHGQIFTGAGIYTVTLASSWGCDSIVSLTLIVNAVAGSLTEKTICLSQLPYSWNGNTYNSAGNYSVSLISAAGCDSIATLQLLTSPVITSVTDTSICQTQLPFNWNGNNYPAAGIYAVTLSSSGGCDSIATLQLTANSPSASNTLVTVCDNQLPYNWNGQQYTASGVYQFTLSNSTGCDSIATLQFAVNHVTSSVSIVRTCENQLPYTWNGHQYATSGNDTIHLTNSLGCDSVAVLQLLINPVKTSLSNAHACSGQLPFIWNGQSLSTPGLHTITLTSSLGCDSVATINLTIYPTPGMPQVVSPVTYCQYESTTPLSAIATTPGASLLWYNSSTGGAGSSQTPLPSSATAGIQTYFVSQVNGLCEGPRAFVTVTVNSKPDVGADQSIRFCFGKTADLSSLYNTNGYTSAWNFSGQPVTDPSVISIPGSYQLVVQNNVGCADTALVNLVIQPEVIADAGNDGDAEYNVPYQMLGSGGGQYDWSPSNVLNNPALANPLAVLTESTLFILTVRDDIGCAASDTVKIRVLRGPTFYVPTAFSPNGDGLNDIFKPTPVGIASLKFFRVFNRYGELVFETNEIGKGWDGTYKGLKQNIGNYVWSLQGTDRTGKLKILKGNVVLIR